MKPQMPTLSTLVTLVLVLVAVTLTACEDQDDETQPADTKVCFPQGSDILVSSTDDIPNMRIVETKTFVMVSKPGRRNLCGIALAFMEQVRVQGGNAAIGFSSMVVTDVMPHTVVVFYGTAVVVEAHEHAKTEE